MKVIFLDFDGVINDWYTFDNVNEENIKRLKKIVDITSAKIVVSSSTKYAFQRDINPVTYEKSKCYNLYVKALMKHGLSIYDYTPYINGNREEEILQYLQDHSEITEYLILDDEYIIEKLKSHEVYLDWYKGITEEHIVPSIRILNGNIGFYPPNYVNDETLEEKNIRINKYYNEDSKVK